MKYAMSFEKFSMSIAKYSMSFRKAGRRKGARRREKEVFELLYPDRESNPELSFRRALLYPFNYQGREFSGAKIVKKVKSEERRVKNLQPPMKKK